MITICTSYIYHENVHEGHRAGPPRDSWFYQLCAHPVVERKKVIDPVSGDTNYEKETDSGRVVLTDEPHPFCRDINDGNCSYFKQKGF